MNNPLRPSAAQIAEFRRGKPQRPVVLFYQFDAPAKAGPDICAALAALALEPVSAASAA